MNSKGQFSIISALLVSIILVSTVIITYSMIFNASVQVQPQVLTAIDETNFAIKQLLGFSVGYYGSVIQVTRDYSFANQSTWNYTTSGLQYVANTHADWGAGFSLANLTIHTYWFNGTSYSTGYLGVNYNLTKLGIYGIQYAPSCGLTVQTANTTGTNQANLIVTQDQNIPVTNLQIQNFEFLNYTYFNSTWQLIPPSTSPTVFSNGTYMVQPPTGINASSYVVQVQDRRGIIVVASQYSSYTMNLAWPSPSFRTSSYQYVGNNASNVDGYSNKGTESNFTAQKSGPDNINDTLTEANFPIISENTQYVESNSSNHDTNIGTTSNFPTEQSKDNTYDALTETNTNATAYIPITFTNTQSSTTPNPFQEQISWNPSSYTSYEASNLGNIRFYSDSALTTPLYAWLESCTPSLSNTATNATAWIKLTSQIAANGGTLTIYMAFLSNAMSFDGNYWGDAPNLSGTYGIYDNGVNVFNAYFNGNTATSNFSVYSGDILAQATGISGPGGTTINAIRVSGSTGAHVPAFSFNKAMSNTALVAESSFSLAAGYTGAATGVVGLVDNATVTSIKNGTSAMMGYSSSYFSQAYEVAGTVTMPVNQAGTSTTSWVYASVTYMGSPASSWSAYIAPQLYSSTGGYSGTVSNNPLSSSGYIYLGQISGSIAINVCYNFVRARAYPPSNVMPSTSLGNVTFPVSNYRLDLERQWTTASYNANASKLLCIKTGAFSDSEALEVDVWNGAWTMLNNNLAANSWNNMSVTTYLTNASFAIRFIDTTTTGDTTQSTWQIDAVLLYTTNSTDNYRLDIEEQWTNVNYTGTNNELDIFTGPFSSPAETLSVQCWNTTSSSWSPPISNLTANSWNNISISTYLTSSTFTIRFLDGSQTGDSVQCSWQIDATLLCNYTNYSIGSAPDMLTVELLQNGTTRWLGQSLTLTTSSYPIPPLPVKSIHLNQTIGGVNSEVPFQIEDWSSDYLIPLGMTSNSSIFTAGNMIVFLANSNVSRVTIWWNGSEAATQTPYAFVDRYFTGDNPTTGSLMNNVGLKLQFDSIFQPVASIGGVSCTASFMRINNYPPTYGGSFSYIITNGVIRDIVQQEAEWGGGGIPSCPNVYSQIVLTLPANATYYTYQLRLIFAQSTTQAPNRSIIDICPIELNSSITPTQTENGNSSAGPIVSTGTGLFFNQSTIWAHHWSQFISGTSGAGIMFTDSANTQLYVFDTLAMNESGNVTGCLRTNSTTGTIELRPVGIAPVNFTYAAETTWYGAVSTFNAVPIYQTTNGSPGGSWIDVEYPPSVAVSPGS